MYFWQDPFTLSRRSQVSWFWRSRSLQEGLKESIYRKFPEWIVLISTRDQHGRHNIMPAGWSMFTSHDPPLYAISVGLTRYTHDVIHETGEFVIGYPAEGMGADIRHTGTHSGPDKLDATAFELTPASVVKPYLMKGCLANLECKLHSSLVTGDHTIFVGEIVKGHYDGEKGRRLLNFGTGAYAVAQMEPGTIYRFQR